MTTDQVSTEARPQGELPARVHTFIAGAGFGGIAAAVKLDEAGERDWVMIDRGTEVGGTWRDNSYPGAACDVPSQLYSLSFAPNKEWSRSFSPQPEIQAYLRKVARDFGILDRCHFETTLERATYDEVERVWHVETNRGTVVADVVVSATGQLSEPKLPDIEGVETFAGAMMHTARWDHDADLTGKRIGIIGTGASAIQIIPEVAKVAGHLTVFQRTAPWVMPRADREYSKVERAALRHVPGLQRLYRLGVYAEREILVPALTRKPELLAPLQAQAKHNIHKAISDPALREAVTPDFRIACKRMLISDDYYPALARDNVSLVTEGISKVTPTGIVTRDGVEHELDVLVVATGFYASEFPLGKHIIGRDGATLFDVWEASGMAAYKSTTINGFPNFFMIVGPNSGLGHSSMVFMIESQVAYVVSALRTLRERALAAVEPKLDVQTAYNDDLQRRMGPTVWHTGGCSSWYLDKHGRNTTLWPRSTVTFRRLLSSFDVDAYDVVPADAPVPVSASAIPLDTTEEISA